MRAAINIFIMSLMWIVKVDSITQYSNYNTLIFEIILLVESLQH